MSLEEDKVDVAIIQEPWIGGGGQIKGLRIGNYNLFHSKKEGKLRTAILVKCSLNILFEPFFSTKDLAVIRCANNKNGIFIASSYMAHDEDVPSIELMQLVSHASRKKMGLVIGSDTNAHNRIWGSKGTNKRGELLLSFIQSTNLLIANKGSEPTFVSPIGESVIDLTLTDNITVNRWKLSEKESLSDHRYIDFEIAFNHTTVCKPFRNPRRADWDKFRDNLNSNSPPSNETIGSTEVLDEKVRNLTKWVTGAFDRACPLSRPRKSKQPPWWSKELSVLRDSARRSFASWKRSQGEELWQAYKANLRVFKKEQRKAMRTSWHSFCDSIESTKETARLRRILSKTKETPSQILKTDGTWTEDSDEILSLLLYTHFPESTSLTVPINEGYANSDTDMDTGTGMVTRERVQWALKSFDPYKSPGPDGVFPILLQEAGEPLVQLLINIFRACLEFEYVPQNWRKSKVVFIPKAGKIQHTTPKDFRPISLSSFLLKTFERVLETHVRENLVDGMVAKSQHAYKKGRSTDTALHSVVSIVERSLESREYTLATFLDIEGAFNNVTTDAIIGALCKHKLNAKVIKWIYELLKNRSVIAEWGGRTSERVANRGTPQGGVLSPLMWLLVVDELLIMLPRTGVRVVAYADDLVILASGIDLNTLSSITTNALNIVQNWAISKGLAVNPNKTELVLFTRRYKIPQFNLPRLNGIELQLGTKAKYLGLTLDSKLLWRENAEERVLKANCAFYACKKMLGSKWGLTPRLAYWTYTAIVRPILSYGALVWWHSLEKQTYRDRLEKVQRMASSAITGALKSTPKEALFAVLNLSHLDLYCKSIAWKTAMRLSNSCFVSKSFGHSRIIWGKDNKSDYVVPTRRFDRNYNVVIPERSFWELGEPPTADIYVYTDGSKTEEKVGAGVFSGNLGLSNSYKMPSYCTVFQAEILAVLKCSRAMEQMSLSGKQIRICVDSQAALKALAKVETRSSLVRECYDSLKALGTNNFVELYWVPGHRDITGNEEADKLAKMGASLDTDAIEAVSPPLQYLYRIAEESTYKDSNLQWKNAKGCRVSKKLWPKFDPSKTNYLLSRTRAECSTLLGVITGHCWLREHAHRIGLFETNRCSHCKAVDSVESVEHLMCFCPSLALKRFESLGSYFLDDLADVSSLPIAGVSRFAKSWHFLTAEQTTPL